MAGLNQTGRVADDYFLIVHDGLSGKPRLPARITGLGLAGAVLGELALQGQIEIIEGCVAVVEGQVSDDALTSRVLAHLQREGAHPVRTWLAFLGQDAAANVAERLCSAGLLVRKPSRLPWSEARWVPTDGNTAALPAALLVTDLVRRRTLNDHTTLLGGLILATGLDQSVLAEARIEPGALEHLHSALDALNTLLRELIGHTEAAVGSAIAAYRA